MSGGSLLIFSCHHKSYFIITDKRKRKAVASMLKIDLDESGDFIIDSKEKASYLIKYLCYKIFKDGETKDILEASTISTLSIS